MKTQEQLKIIYEKILAEAKEFVLYRENPYDYSCIECEVDGDKKYQFSITGKVDIPEADETGAWDKNSVTYDIDFFEACYVDLDNDLAFKIYEDGTTELLFGEYSLFEIFVGVFN